MLKTLTALALCLVACQGLSLQASAQGFPSRPITLIVPFSAGGPTDTIARLMAQGINKALGQSVVVDNVTGASGAIGVGRTARAAPDGYTIGIGSWSTHVVDSAVNALPYDTYEDFQPLAMVAINPQVLIGKASLPAQNMQELVKWIKIDPKRVLVGTTGPGTAAHIAAVYFANKIGVELTYVPYRGAAIIVQDMIGDRIDLLFAQASQAIGFVRAGTVKGYAVTAKTRLAALPDVPTVDEAGLPGLYVTLWHAIWAPKGMPKEVIEALNGALTKTLADPVIQKRLIELGQDIPSLEQQTPQGLAAYHKAEIEKWNPLIKAMKIKTN